MRDGDRAAGFSVSGMLLVVFRGNFPREDYNFGNFGLEFPESSGFFPEVLPSADLRAVWFWSVSDRAARPQNRARSVLWVYRRYRPWRAAVRCSNTGEKVRETETWMPMKSTAAIGMSTHRDDLEASGDSEDGADFSFTDDEDYDSYGFSGSGDEETPELPTAKSRPSVRPDINDNKIPELDPPVLPTINEMDVIKESNEIPGLKKSRESNVSMSHAGEDSILNKTEVLAALIAGGAVSLLFAVLLILLLIYRMKKKDEGSYDLGKKPIYKKAPTTEIYA